jgi:formamidopyrimidine-DNA glycosylase
MPELPEVETIRRQLAPLIAARRIERAEVLDPRWSRPEPPGVVSDALEGARIEAVERRGKYLILRLDADRALVMHLRMTGNLLLRAAGREGVADLMEEEPFGESRFRGGAAVPHLRARLLLDDGAELLFTDPRRFGHGAVMRASDLDAYLAARVGLEPLTDELTSEALAELAAGRRAPLKSFLLGQTGIAGIGNIYADEALWRARLHPLSPAGSMKREHCEALRRGIVEALEAGLANGGASIDDYRDLRGGRGSMQEELVVHTREGRECVRCGAQIRRIVVAGRSTYFCPGCQTRLRRRRAGRRRRRARAPR